MSNEAVKTKQSNPKRAVKIIKDVLWGIAWAILGLLAVVLVWLSIDKYILKSPVPSFLGYSSLTIETGSMNGYSSLAEGKEAKQVGIGDLIIIKKTGDYKIGDVITFLPEGDKIPTTHRIIGIDGDCYITKGDANNVKDTVPVSKDCVLGEVVGHYPKLGKFSSWVKKEGWIYITATFAIIMLGSVIFKNSNQKEEHTANAATDSDGASKSDETAEK